MLHIDITGQTTGDMARTGPRLAAAPYPAMATFELATAWRRRRPAELSRGPTQGINWWAYARLVQYWFDPLGGSDASESYWAADNDFGDAASSMPDSASAGSHNRLTPICYAIGAPSDSGSSGSASGAGAAWQMILYPRYEVGQWVQCLYDARAGIWRVMESYEQIVRFQLTEPMPSFGKAKARVFAPARSSSSSSEERRWRGSITVHDVIGVAAGSLSSGSMSTSGEQMAEASTCGYAKRFADSRRWEVLQLGGSPRWS